MKPVFVNSASCISVQDTLNPDFMNNLKPQRGEVLLNAIAPNYKDYISPGMIRRMSKTVKMSSVAAQKALEEANIDQPDAIIVGTGMGCEEDSEKFLNNVIHNDEQFLTPTHFIQSTHNTVAGQIALARNCHGYNFTYVNSGSSLEMSLLDAKLQLENGEAQHILVGATDEKAARTMELYQLAGTVKKESDLPADFLDSSSNGVVWGEGSAFFMLSDEKTANSYSQLKGVTFINELENGETEKFIGRFLQRNGLDFSDIDVVILGFSSDAKSDRYYKEVQDYFDQSALLYYKHLSGEFNTANGFAFFLANHILKNQKIPDVMKINGVEKSKISNILIYDHLGVIDHGLILLSKVD